MQKFKLFCVWGLFCAGLAGCATNEPSYDRNPQPIYNPEPYIPTPPSATALYQQGRDHYENADYNGAIAAFQQALDANPDYADAYFWLGNAYRKLNADEQALRAYKNCLRIQPHHADAHLYSAILFIAQYQYVPAESHLQQAIEDDPSNPLSYYYLAEVYRKQNQCEEPVRLYKKALAINPDLHDARMALKEVNSRNCVNKNKKPKPAASAYQKVAPGSGLQGGGKALQPHEW